MRSTSLYTREAFVSNRLTDKSQFINQECRLKSQKSLAIFSLFYLMKNTLKSQGYRNADCKIRRTGKPPKSEHCRPCDKCPLPTEKKSQKITHPYRWADNNAHNAEQQKRPPILALSPYPRKKINRRLFYLFKNSFHSTVHLAKKQLAFSKTNCNLSNSLLLRRRGTAERWMRRSPLNG